MAVNIKRKPEEGIDEWIVTYGDMVTLLLTFFILIVAMSSPDKGKIDKAIKSIQGSLGTSGVSAEMAMLSEKKSEASFQNLGSQVKNLVIEGNLQDVVDVKVTELGIVMNMTGGVLFRAG